MVSSFNRLNIRFAGNQARNGGMLDLFGLNGIDHSLKVAPGSGGKNHNMFHAGVILEMS